MSKGPPRILVVEDEGITLLDLERTLRRLGYEVVRAVATADEAVAACAQEAPDLVLTDIVLRGSVDGIDAAVAMRARRPVPVVFLTAYGDLRTLDRARAAEPYGYLIKPFHDEELRSTIETALLRVELERRLEEARARQQVLLARVEEAREEERTRLSRELHDELGQYLTHVRLELAWLRDHPGMEAAELAARVSTLAGGAEGALRSLRRIVAALRPPILDEGGLLAAVEWECRSFSERTRLPCRLEAPLAPEAAARLGPPRSTTLFRILQESLTNVARHARAAEVRVRLEQRGQDVRLVVSDDGVGVGAGRQAPLALPGGGVGIVGMRERAAAHGGRVEVAPGPGGRGLQVVATLPLPPAPEAPP